MGVVAVCALVFLAAFSTGVPGYFRDVMSEGPITAALPAAVGAWVLAMAGAVATVFAGFGLPWWTRRVKSTLGGRCRRRGRGVRRGRHAAGVHR
ncbi:hypothetical protein ATO49_17700 [Mycolicibacterium fortuitum subsp. fortuitum DSM 46621 = ATCC 6841 = JCM 6387]|nr:hypothetical protein ATO49_17700 [Mycolicibacterium fortuitum subsp. fortuitum DSM 46621 = ATCC 6841 = JCM 6387]